MVGGVGGASCWRRIVMMALVVMAEGETALATLVVARAGMMAAAARAGMMAAAARAGMMAAAARADGGRAGGASKDRWFDGATGGIPPQAKIEEGNRAVILGAGSRCESAAPDRSTAGAL